MPEVLNASNMGHFTPGPCRAAAEPCVRHVAGIAAMLASVGVATPLVLAACAPLVTSVISLVAAKEKEKARQKQARDHPLRLFSDLSPELGKLTGIAHKINAIQLAEELKCQHAQQDDGNAARTFFDAHQAV